MITTLIRFMRKMGEILRSYPRTFWIVNIVELLERWGWYGMYMVLALYMTESTDTGALGFSPAQSGLIMGIGTGVLYFLPLFTGAIADKVGYKKMLLISFVIYVIGFIAISRVGSFYGVLSIYLLIAVGSAMFKPIPAATVTKTTNDTSASIGFGIYYMMVNVGGLGGPFTASKLRPHSTESAGSWSDVFLMSASMMVVSFVLVTFFYREPLREKNGDSLKETIKQVLINLGTTLKDYRLVIFLLIAVGFWTVYYQLFYTLGIFVNQWVDTAELYQRLHSSLPWLARAVGTAEETISAEIMTTLPALYIVVLQIWISALVMKWHPVNSIITGVCVNVIGLCLAFLTRNPMFLVLALVIFALGEMACSPKITEYLGRMAPKDKRALYIGCSFLPIAGGSFFGGLLAALYSEMSDKITLVKRLAEERQLRVAEIGEAFTQNDLLKQVSQQLNLDSRGLTELLWTVYAPYRFWYVIATIGIATVIGLALFNHLLVKSERQNAD